MSRRLADRYVLGDEVGVGGMSRVHVAIDERLGRRVAVKLHDASVVATADPAGRERFLREGRTTAGFSHPHAVTVFDAGEDAGDLYIVMEFVDGPSLAEHLARSGPLRVDEMIRISRQVLSALAAAHAAGIVHRDVKPANILIGADGDTKLADFGIAKRFDDLGASVTSTGIVIGTPRYLAPEQALGHAATPATDVYSMGVVMFEMLTGRLPFDTDPLVAATDATQQSTAVRLRSLRPEVPAALAGVVASALAPQPADRPATAAALLVAFDEASSPHDGSTRVAEPTLVMPVGSSPHGAAATEVLPSAPPEAHHVTSERSSGRTAVLLFVGLLVLLGGVVAAAALGSRDDADGVVVTVAPTSTLAVPADTAPVAPAPPPPEATATAPTLPEPIAITARVVEVVVPEPTVVTLVPGFAVTDDLEVFLLQVESDPDALGQSGAELADELRKVIEQRGGEQRESAEKLQEVLVGWADDGEIPSAIAVALDELLAPLAKNG
jgi:serine/threonine-protein kinase